MKNKLAIASAFLAASSCSVAEIVVNEFLSFEGFIDSSYTHARTEVAGAESSQDRFQIDQIEISGLFDFDSISAQIDLEYQNSSDGGGLDGDTQVEQAFVRYELVAGRAVTIGRYQSMLGFEAFEPTGLFQYSTAYGLDALIHGHQQGAKYTQSSEATFIGASVQHSSLGDRYDDPLSPGGFGAELAAAIQLDSGVSLFLGGAFEDGDNQGESYVINSYASYQLGVWVFAAELNYGTVEGAWSTELAANDRFTLAASIGDYDVLSSLLLANFAYHQRASVTGRLSHQQGSFGAADFDVTRYTLAHNYALSDNLLVVAELSYDDGEWGVQELQVLSAAVEMLFSF